MRFLPLQHTQKTAYPGFKSVYSKLKTKAVSTNKDKFVHSEPKKNHQGWKPEKLSSQLQRKKKDIDIAQYSVLYCAQ